MDGVLAYRFRKVFIDKLALRHVPRASSAINRTDAASSMS